MVWSDSPEAGNLDTLRWLRDCLREDRARRGIRDFTSPAGEARRFLTGTEHLATGTSPDEVVGPAFARKVLERCQEYGREREVVYGTLFLACIFHTLETLSISLPPRCNS
jgi:hypothetical protein